MSPERTGEEPSKEHEPQPYYQAARFSSEQVAGKAYFLAQRLIYQADCDLSSYRFQLQSIYHVAVLGEQPPDELHHRLANILSGGDIVSLPAEIIKVLQERRAQATKVSPWLERHYRPGKCLK